MNKNADYRDAEFQNGQTADEIHQAAIAEEPILSPRDEIVERLKTLKQSCRDGIDGTWDCDLPGARDDGFLSMVNSIDEVLRLVKLI